MQDPGFDNGREACRTYVGQTKLLVTLASVFVIASPVLAGYIRTSHPTAFSTYNAVAMVVAELLFISSVLCGHVVLGSIVRSQQAGAYDILGPVTRVFSAGQFACYAVGLLCLFVMTMSLVF